jgi:hypothetical protein
MQQANVQLVHKKFAAMVFEEGLALKVSKSLALREFIDALQSLPRGVTYRPPAPNTLRGPLLQQAKADVDRSLGSWTARCSVTGMTVSSDGWADPTNTPLLNVMGTNPQGSKFLTAINTEGETKTSAYIAGKIMAVIEEVGPENVVQVRVVTVTYQPSKGGCARHAI